VNVELYAQKNCSNHGKCVCGICECEVGWNLLQDCSCSENCTDDCNGNGNCNCDGTCTCFPGYSGVSCGNKTTCDTYDCLECTNNKHCLWCPIADEVKNINASCYHVSDLKKSICTKKENFLQPGSECIFVKIEQPPAIVSTPTFIALGVGLGALALLAIGLAFLLKKSKTNDDMLLHGKDPFSEGQVLQNPDYKAQTEVVQNKLFETGIGDDKL